MKRLIPYKEIDEKIIFILNDGKDHNLMEIVNELRKIYDNFSRSTTWDHLMKLIDRKEIHFTKGEEFGSWKTMVFHRDEKK